MGAMAANMATITNGLPGFFKPNLMAFMSMFSQLGPEKKGYDSTQPLMKTLSSLIDLDLMNSKAPRLAVSAVNVASGDMHYFDSRDETLNLAHMMASGALPPAFPAVRIGGELIDFLGGANHDYPLAPLNELRVARVHDRGVLSPHMLASLGTAALILLERRSVVIAVCFRHTCLPALVLRLSYYWNGAVWLCV